MVYHTLYFHYGILVIRLSVFQSYIYPMHLVFHISNYFFFLDSVYVVDVSFPIQTVLGVVCPLTFPSFDRFPLFSIFNKIVRHIPAFWCYSILGYSILKINFLIIILEEVLRFTPKTLVWLESSYSLFKITCLFSLPVR